LDFPNEIYSEEQKLNIIEKIKEEMNIFFMEELEKFKIKKNEMKFMKYWGRDFDIERSYDIFFLFFFYYFNNFLFFFSVF
jgi:hypothetical protein